MQNNNSTCYIKSSYFQHRSITIWPPGIVNHNDTYEPLQEILTQFMTNSNKFWQFPTRHDNL
jgi:hypothetical protein